MPARRPLALAFALALLVTFSPRPRVAASPPHPTPQTPPPSSLPDTEPLEVEGDLAALMVDRIHEFLLGEIAASPERRQRHWDRDYSSPEAYEASIAPNRERFRRAIGAIDARVAPVEMELVATVGGTADTAGGTGVSPVAASPSLSGTGVSPVVAETQAYTIYAVRWPVFEGVHGEGLLIQPKGEIAARVVAIPDADWAPEQIAGLAPPLPPDEHFARRLAESVIADADDAVLGGIQVLVPTLIDRSDAWSGIAELRVVTSSERLEAHALAPSDVIDALRAAGLDVEGTTAGDVAGDVVIPVRGAFQGPEALGELIVAQHDGAAILLRDLAEVRVETYRLTNQPHREFIYRQAYELGRHIIGYEVQKVLAGIDWFESEARHAGEEDPAICVMGYGEGGLLAFYAAALDTRIDAAVVSGYFGPRENVWQEPIYRNVWRLLDEFGDAEIAGLIAPRYLSIEISPQPEVAGPPPAREGRSGAAPGVIRTPDFAAVDREIRRYAENQVMGPISWTGTHPGLSADDILAYVASLRGGDWRQLRAPVVLEDQRSDFDPQQRLRRQFDELCNFTQRLMRESEQERARFWADGDMSSLEAWQASCRPYREYFWNEVIGRFPDPSLPANPRTRLAYETERWVGYEVMLDVWPIDGGQGSGVGGQGDASGANAGQRDALQRQDDLLVPKRSHAERGNEEHAVFAYGVLLVPRDLQPGERRPVVVCQHGLEGRPHDTITRDPTENGFHYYSGFSAELADRGFVVYAPQNPYIGGDRFRVLQRMANPLGRSLFSVIIGQHQQTLDWLQSLPFVDPDRIAFYGLSYGGKTAMRVPAILEDYCLSICSADFNEWIWKNCSITSPYSYVFTGEYEMFEFNLGNTFNYAEMANLIAPRPFMVERGHHDGVAPDEWVAYEYAQVRRTYAQLGIAERTEIEFFNGPHQIHGVGTYEFLHRHLDWPAPQQ